MPFVPTTTGSPVVAAPARTSDPESPSQTRTASIFPEPGRFQSSPAFATAPRRNPMIGSSPMSGLSHPSWDNPTRAFSDQSSFDRILTDVPVALDPAADHGEYLPTGRPRSHGKSQGQRRPSNRDEFDGPHQLLDMPSAESIAAQEQDLPSLPMTLDVQEQDDLLSQVNGRLSQCAFDFVAKYQFPIPLESDKRPVRGPADREWNEWVFLLKRLATKRRIPARVLYNGQIKQFITVLENSLEMRHSVAHQYDHACGVLYWHKRGGNLFSRSRPSKDDRNVLQLISAGIQVTKILRDATGMRFLDGIYVYTENLIRHRRGAQSFTS
ncbi:MAG: hypothetical protein M1833_006535 [Piccolia ochrophora]|nr:MAG: hypothetical protein M1833_006535 [Piccolia ochrophora]